LDGDNLGRRRRRRSIEETSELRVPAEGEILGIIVQLLGFDRAKVKCADGYTRVCRIPGRYRKRMWMREGDIVLIVPWDFQFETRGDIVWRYTKDEVYKLRNQGLIPEDLELEY